MRELVEYSEAYAVGIPASAVPEQEFFFGRSDLIDDILTEAKQCYQRKRLGVSILRGPAGVGKTAISQAVSYLASRRGWLVLRGKCYNRESLIYQAWDELAAQLDQIFEELPEDIQHKVDACRRQSALLFPVLGRPDDPPAPELSRLDVIDSLRSLLRRLSTQRPLLLLMDDLHWASWDSAGLLLDLIGEPRGLRCMVLGTWLGGGDDGSSDHPLLTGLQTCPAPVRWLDVRGFSKDEAREYVISAGSHLSLQDQRRVLKRGEFNPLLLEELIYEARPDEVEPDEAVPMPARTAPVSEKLTEMIEARIEALNRRERFVLEVLSVASIPLPGTMIATILDEEFRRGQSVENTAQDALARLLETRFVERIDSHHWDVAYTVAHNSYREFILGQLRQQRYAHLCKRIADGVRRGWPAAEELRFEYLLRAGQNRDAADAALRAAASAEERFAYNRAAKLWRWLSAHGGVVSLTPGTRPMAEHARLELLAHRFDDAADLYGQVAAEPPNDIARADYLGSAFEACVRAGRHQAARQALDDALGIFGEHYYRSGLLTRLGQVKDRALAATGRWSDSTDRVQVGTATKQQTLRAELYRLALDVEDLLDPANTERLRTRLSVLAKGTRDARLVGLDRMYLARQISQYEGARRHERVTGWLDDAATLVERAGDWELRGLCELSRADQFRLRGQFDEADERLNMAAKYLRSAGRRKLHHRHLLKLGLARLLLDRGQLGDADFLARQLLHFWRGDRYVSFRAHQVLIPTHLLAGRTGHVEHLLDRCREYIADTPTDLADVWVARMSARLNIALGRPEVAVGQLDVLAEKMHRSGLLKHGWAAATLSLSLGQALAALAEREQALVESRHTETLERLKDTVGTLESYRGILPRVTRAEVARLISRMELLRGHPKKALKALDEAVGLLLRYDNPIERAKCLEARGVILRTLEVSDAPAMIELALAVYQHYDARLPLFLEGWPVPSKHSRLAKDDE